MTAHAWLVVSLVVCLLGLVGTPPTAVFVGKLTVFIATRDGDLSWLVVGAAINTIASLVYYLRWLGPAFGGVPAAPSARELAPGAGPGTSGSTAQRVPPASGAVVVHVAAAGSVVLGITAGVLITAAMPA